MSLRVAIIGGGPGGTTLARLLQINNVHCTIYELDNAALSRFQGGSLDLHPETGQRALKEANLFDEFEKHARREGAAAKFMNSAGKVLLDLKGEGERADRRPEIDRSALRDLLIESLKPNTIQWEKKLLRVEMKANDKPTLYFADGSVEESYDLVVGADGAWSKVRCILTDVKPYFSGIYGIETRIADVNDRFPKTGELIGDGSCFCFGEGRALMAQRNGDKSVRIYGMIRLPEDWKETSGIDWQDRDAAIETYLARYFEKWDENIKFWMRAGGEDILQRPLYMLPVGLKWPSKPGVTVLGDAAHLMSPFAGVGVNLAMTDALDLSKAIIAASRNETSLSAAIAKYEVAMFERSEPDATKTLNNLNLMFSGDTAEEIVNALMQRFGSNGLANN